MKCEMLHVRRNAQARQQCPNNATVTVEGPGGVAHLCPNCAKQAARGGGHYLTNDRMLWQLPDGSVTVYAPRPPIERDPDDYPLFARATYTSNHSPWVDEAFYEVAQSSWSVTIERPATDAPWNIDVGTLRCDGEYDDYTCWTERLTPTEASQLAQAILEAVRLTETLNGGLR